MRFLLVALLALPVSAAEEEEPAAIPGVECRGDVCLIPFTVLNALIDMHNKQVDDIRVLKKAGPKCAQIEVTEPSQNAPKKQMPPIKSEGKS